MREFPEFVNLSVIVIVCSILYVGSAFSPSSIFIFYLFFFIFLSYIRYIGNSYMVEKNPGQNKRHLCYTLCYILCCLCYTIGAAARRAAGFFHGFTLRGGAAKRSRLCHHAGGRGALIAKKPGGQSKPRPAATNRQAAP